MNDGEVWVRLVGGPYDGAEGVCWDGCETLWVLPDPQHRGPYGLIVGTEPAAGAERYDFLREDGDAFVYVHDGTNFDSPVDRILDYVGA